MTRWEYMLLDIGVARFWLGPQLDGDAVTERLNELGAEGWEAIGLSGLAMAQGRTADLVIILKRPRV